MHADPVRLDLANAKTPLYVRQALALFLGLQIDREFTWEFFDECISNHSGLTLPKNIVVWGLIRLSMVMPEEEHKLRDWLRKLQLQHPEVVVQFVLHY